MGFWTKFFYEVSEKVAANYLEKILDLLIDLLINLFLDN